MQPSINRIGEVYEPFKVRFLERPIPPLAPDEVLVRVKASAICGSDLHIARGLHPSAPLPVTIGHEFSGDIAAVGSDVRKVKVGAWVTVEPCIVCGKCDACRHGQYGYCEQISFTYRNGDGAMADYVVVKEPYVYELPDYLTYETGALIEPLSVATHAVRRADIRLGETVLIIGAGAIGMMVASMCRRSGAAEIIIADFSDQRLEMALQVGATVAVNSGREDLEEAVARITHGKGVDKSFECVGRESCFLQAIMTLKRNGTATIVGIYEKPQVQFPASRLVTHEIHIQGAQGYCWDFPIAIAAARDIPLEKFITHTFPLDQLQQALDTALDRNSGSIKVILKP
ncbi:MAG TPA: alcohol dehydrogenase catalytic domain-containing protein [Subdoligranulum variabile]|uniref:Alcohol dehydrogenase catalytic domain-containing protein n=1 Tax=Subdoligranulum variabile TaxID=214851 RepID=A0A921IN05_9FIRM|nr:alcohol dehydrogenase catalytic domain-containing protein [Subdoligranulum variabile]